MIDFNALPIDRPNSQAYNALVKRMRDDLAKDGCAVVKRVLTDDGLTALAAEAERTAPKAHRSFNRTNAYFTKDDPSLPEDHPRRRFYDRSNAFVAADNFPKDGPLRRVHDHPGFDAFVRDCLQEEKFFRYADPLADVIINTAGEGAGFPWHFDTNNFTVTLAIQNASSGGAFEYAPGIRTATEENFDAVQAVLDGTSENVTVLHLEPGDLQLFKGRYSLHRVAPLKGPRPRHVAIFSYVEEPGMVGKPERARQLYGRVLPIHLEQADVRGDTLID